MSEYKFSFPKIYNKNWYIFKDAIFSNLETSGCIDSIDGICHNTKNVNECIKLCEDDKNCNQGYFIETPDKNNYCVPLRKYDYKEISPYYKLRNKNIYPVMKNMKVNTFVKTIFPYPPNLPNVMFYGDYFFIKSVETKKFIGMNDNNNLTHKLLFTENNPVNLQFLPSIVSKNYAENYIPLRNQDEIFINVPYTSFMLNSDLNSNILWNVSGNIEKNYFKINTIINFESDLLNYSQHVYFTFNNLLLTYDEKTNSLNLENINTEKASQNKKNFLFELIPQVQVNYCENNKCKKVNLQDTERNGINATFKGYKVQRNPECWNNCEKSNFSQLYIVIIIIIIIIIIFLKFNFKLF